MRTLKRSIFVLPVLTAVFVASAANPAHALSLILGVGNTGLSGYTGPFGQVDITWVDATHANVALTSLGPVGAYNYFFGNGQSLALNTNGSATVVGGVSSITSTQIQASPLAPVYTLTSGNADGFGSFNFVLDNTDGYQHSVSTLNFTLQKSSGSWSSDADVLTANAKGQLAAGHVFVVNNDAGYTNTGVTGFAADGVAAVPEPFSLTLLGGGLLGLGALRARKKKN